MAERAIDAPRLSELIKVQKAAGWTAGKRVPSKPLKRSFSAEHVVSRHVESRDGKRKIL